MSTTSYLRMPDESAVNDLLKTLTDSFNLLADEVQLLSDRKTILEHKLRFAHEQYQNLADKYALADPDIPKTLAKLQLPPKSNVQTPERATFVPLPSRRPVGSKQKTTETIRDGRKASQKIAELRGWKPSSDIGNRSETHSLSGTTDSIIRTSRLGTSATTVLEQDFTVPGKKSLLLCPFAQMTNASKSAADTGQQTSDSVSPLVNTKDNTPHQSADPICAALFAETRSSPPPSATGSAAKCPIRFLDQHSPEEVARYFETHKHEIPRSHEVCVKRYQRNEEDIRKLDAKYGNLVSMISGLGQKHQPMLLMKEEDRDDYEVTKTNERVNYWAKNVSSVGDENVDGTADTKEEGNDRENRFDRAMKEVRLGESPSRPWGIPVPYVVPPVQEEEIKRSSSPPAPPHVPDARPDSKVEAAKRADKCPFGHGQQAKDPANPIQEAKAAELPTSQPNFLQPPDFGGGAPFTPMVFNGPVFIGYPVEQAMALMQQWQAGINGNR